MTVDLNHREYVRLAEERIAQQADILATKNKELRNLRSLLTDRNEEIGRLNRFINEKIAAGNESDRVTCEPQQQEG